MTASEKITAYLAERPGQWLAVHELGLGFVSQNAAAARLRELTRLGVLENRVRKGKRFKEWRYKTPQEQAA